MLLRTGGQLKIHTRDRVCTATELQGRTHTPQRSMLLHASRLCLTSVPLPVHRWGTAAPG